MSATFLRNIQRKFWMTHTTGVTAQTPFGLLARMYWTQYLADPTITIANTTYADLQIRWMKKWMNDHGVAPPNTKYMQVLWKYLVGSAGIAPSNFTRDNEIQFYLNAP